MPAWTLSNIATAWISVDNYTSTVGVIHRVGVVGLSWQAWVWLPWCYEYFAGLPTLEVSQVLFRLSRWENLEYAKKI